VKCSIKLKIAKVTMKKNIEEKKVTSGMADQNSSWVQSPVYKFLMNYPYVFIFILASVVFAQTLSFGFVHMDDYAIVGEILSGIGSISNIFNSFTEGYGGNFYRPLQTFTLVIDMEISGGAAWSFHLGNLLLHSFTAVAVYYLFRNLKFDGAKSLIAATIFAINPLMTHAVAWIPSRGDLLFGFSVVIGFIGFVQYLKTLKWKYYAMHIFGFLMAFFSKETAVFFPVLCISYIFIFTDRKKIFSSQNIYLYSGWLVAGLIWYYLRSLSVMTIPDMRVLGIDQFLDNFPLIPETIAKFIFPFYISVMPTFNIFWIIAGVVLFGLFVARMITQKDKRYSEYLFAAIWFFGFLFPVMIFRHPDSDKFYDYLDHRSYLPLIGLIFAILISIPDKWKNLKVKRNSIIFLFIILILSGFTFAQSMNYKSPTKFWVSAIKHDNTRPSFFYGLGYYLLKEKSDNKNARAMFLKAIEADSSYEKAFAQLGYVAMKLKNYPEAEKYLIKAMLINPGNKEAPINLSATFNNTEKYEKSIKLLREYLRRYPDDKNAYLNLFEAYRNTDRYKEAYDVAKRLVQLGENKDYFSAFLNIGAKFYREKRFKEALEVTKIALQFPGDHPRAVNNLGLFNLSLKNYKEAEKYLLEAHKLDNKLPNAYTNLIDLYINHLKDYKKAAKFYKQYIDLGYKMDDNVKRILEPYLN
jgi:tetratricopeptide (TPR) repeat protein